MEIRWTLATESEHSVRKKTSSFVRKKVPTVEIFIDSVAVFLRRRNIMSTDVFPTDRFQTKGSKALIRAWTSPMRPDPIKIFQHR